MGEIKQDRGASADADHATHEPSRSVSALRVGIASAEQVPLAVEQEIRRRAIEEAIGWVEESSFREVFGILAKRKRDREDAALRGKAIREERAALVSVMRARLNNESGTLLRALKEIRDGTLGFKTGLSHYDLLDAAMLAKRGLVKLTVTAEWSDGWRSPDVNTCWRAEITEKGLAELEFAARQDAPESPTP